MKAWRILASLLIILLLLTVTSPAGKVFAEKSSQADPAVLAEQMLALMTAEEKVGQLFLVSFEGSEVSSNPQLQQLISQYHIGGVVLSARNDNFQGPADTLIQAYGLNADLQRVEWESSQVEQMDPETQELFTPRYIPLFIGISQEGDLTPYDQIINGLTALPNQMAIGATWDSNMAQKVGAVAGQELSALGFNLVFGPSLDVLEVLQAADGTDLGTRTFGGDPYWVGKMGAAYIQGLHEGSSNRIAVIAKYFPGRGGSDRLPDEEVATVRKSLEQLKQIELAPFFTVTGTAEEPSMRADGLLVSHIRYQGFQGNIRATTRPVSFDWDSLDQLLNLEPFSTWRSGGGVIISDNLGSQAVRKFFDPIGLTFDARNVARTAFLAGNDLLYVDNFISNTDPDQYTTLVNTLDFFTQKYREDQAFKELVDQSVLRILTLKYQVFQNQFEFSTVIPPVEGLDEIGNSQQVSFEVAQDALTLVSPEISQLAEVLPNAPAAGERVVFITDISSGKQCSTCDEQPELAMDSLMNAVNRLYSTQAGGDILRNYLKSYSFTDLEYFLSNPEVPPVLAEDLQLAEWVVFSIASTSSERPESLALLNLLRERPEVLKDKKVIVFAFTTPDYLDATDISKLTAYYALYTKVPEAVDVAARALFQEIVPFGNLPVSVPAIGYDLISVTAPEASQVIALYIDQPEMEQPSLGSTPQDSTPQPTPVLQFRVGDSLPIRTGVIYDKNGNPVPDGTVVRFTVTINGDSTTVQLIDTQTSEGIARTIYRISTPGLVEIKASSDPAMLSQIITLDATNQVAQITIIAPPPVLTAETSTAMTPTPEPTEMAADEDENRPTGGDWLLSMLLIWAAGAGAFLFGRHYISFRWGFRWGVCTVLGGLLVYTILVLFIPISLQWSDPAGRLGLLIALLAGCAAGWAAGYFWRSRGLEKFLRRAE